MNYFAITSLAVSICCFCLGVFILIIARTKVHKIWGWFNISCFAWAIGTFFAAISKTPYLAEFSWRWAYGLGSIVPYVFYQFNYEFCEISKKKTLIFIRIFGFLFVFLNLFSPYFITELDYLFGEFYYNKANMQFSFFLLYLFSVVGLSFKELLEYYKKSIGNKQLQTLYLLWGFGIGWSGGGATFLPAYGVLLYPVWNIVVCVYTLLMTYAIFKYQLIDLKIAATRVSVFVLVYTLVLGIPFALAFGYQEQLQDLIGKNWWVVPLISSTVLATVGPLLYLYLQKKAEGRLLEEQHQYQSTLRKASMGMGRIKDLKKLLNLIVHIVVRAVKIENSEVYLLHEESKSYVLKASKSLQIIPDSDQRIKGDSPVIMILKKQKEPLVFDELKQRSKDHGDKYLNNALADMEALSAALIVPSFIENKLIALIVLGKKRSGKPFSQDDLMVFSILANQSALAIENAIFYEESKRTQAQLFKAEKMATIGTMADGLSHQINNRLHAMGFIAGDAIDTINIKQQEDLPEDIKKTLDDVRYSLKRIEENVKQGGEIVSGLLKYTRKGESGMETVDLRVLLKSAMEMVQFKIKVGQMKLVSEIDEDSPKVWGNFTQLQEVFFNIIDNSYDAMMQRKDELKEEGYQPVIHFSALTFDNKVEIKIQDNGIGVKGENVEKLFTPFFTTKATSKKGTGLGLYVIRQLIEENHGGKVDFKSEYKVGSQTKIVLSVAKKKVEKIQST